jgi:hypothetical protein
MTEIADRIVEILTPVVGTGLAVSAVNMQCRKMSILPEKLHGPVLFEFADRFQKPLEYFAGSAVADEIVRRIKALESPTVPDKN